MNGDNFLIGMGVIALICIAIGVGGCMNAVASPVKRAQPVHCAEDAPCWTWSTMGNGKRGVTLNDITHKRVVVNHDGFCFLRRMNVIDWHRTAHLKGDRC